MKIDPYKVLEIEKGASEQEIKNAYKKLAKKYHPDYNPDDLVALEKCKEINEAFEILEKIKRREEQKNKEEIKKKYILLIRGMYYLEPDLKKYFIDRIKNSIDLFEIKNNFNSAFLKNAKNQAIIEISLLSFLKKDEISNLIRRLLESNNVEYILNIYKEAKDFNSKRSISKLNETLDPLISLIKEESCKKI